MLTRNNTVSWIRGLRNKIQSDLQCENSPSTITVLSKSIISRANKAKNNYNDPRIHCNILKQPEIGQ